MRQSGPPAAVRRRRGPDGCRLEKRLAHPPVHAVTRGEGAQRKRGACDVGRDLDGAEDA